MVNKLALSKLQKSIDFYSKKVDNVLNNRIGRERELPANPDQINRVNGRMATINFITSRRAPELYGAFRFLMPGRRRAPKGEESMSRIILYNGEAITKPEQFAEVLKNRKAESSIKVDAGLIVEQLDMLQNSYRIIGQDEGIQGLWIEAEEKDPTAIIDQVFEDVKAILADVLNGWTPDQAGHIPAM